MAVSIYTPELRRHQPAQDPLADTFDAPTRAHIAPIFGSLMVFASTMRERGEHEARALKYGMPVHTPEATLGQRLRERHHAAFSAVVARGVALSLEADQQRAERVRQAARPINPMTGAGTLYQWHGQGLLSGNLGMRHQAPSPAPIRSGDQQTSYALLPPPASRPLRQQLAQFANEVVNDVIEFTATTALLVCAGIDKLSRIISSNGGISPISDTCGEEPRSLELRRLRDKGWARIAKMMQNPDLR